MSDTRCCCPHTDARECIRTRSAYRPDEEEFWDERCECQCHYEAAEDDADRHECWWTP